jgi:hypothetical protein
MIHLGAIVSPTYHSMHLRSVSVELIRTSRNGYGYIHFMTMPREIGDIMSVQLQQRVQHSIPGFLENEAKVSSSSPAIMASNGYRYGSCSQVVPKRMTGVHLASWFGLTQITLYAFLSDLHSQKTSYSTDFAPSLSPTMAVDVGR